MGWRSSRLRSVAAILAVLLACSCSGSRADLLHVSCGYPYFHHLEVFVDRITAVSPDSKTLRGLSLDGGEIWRRSITDDPMVGRFDDEHLYVQEENTVFRLRVRDGATQALFDVPEHQQFVQDRTHDVIYLTDRRFDRNTFQLLDPVSHRALWQREDIESVLHSQQDLLVVATATRDYDANRQSYSTRDVVVAGLSRRTGEIRWRVPLDGQTGFVTAAAVSPCLVVIDEGAGGGLVCIDPGSGRVLGRRAHSRSWGLSYWDVISNAEHIAFLENGDSSDEMFLRFARIPSFEVTESIRLARNEPSLFLTGNYIVTTGLYRTVCFDRRTGARLWERALVGAWKPLGDQILVSDYDKRAGLTRLVIIDLASRSERVILAEPASPSAQ